MKNKTFKMKNNSAMCSFDEDFLECYNNISLMPIKQRADLISFILQLYEAKKQIIIMDSKKRGD
jgi:hypothetical protein